MVAAGGVTFEIGDAENESGDIETESSFAVEGNNNNTCLGQLQFGNISNFTNQQGALKFGSPDNDFRCLNHDNDSRRFEHDNGFRFFWDTTMATLRLVTKRLGSCPRTKPRAIRRFGRLSWPPLGE